MIMMTQEEIHNVFQEVHQVWPISLAGTAIIGLVLWLMGRKMIRPAMAICGVCIGAAIGFTLSHHFNTNDGLLMTWTGVGAVAGGLAAWLLYRAWMAISLGLLAAVFVPATAIAFTGTPDPIEGDLLNPSSNLVQEPTQLTEPPLVNTSKDDDAKDGTKDETKDSNTIDGKDDTNSLTDNLVNQFSPEQIANAAKEQAGVFIEEIQKTLMGAIRAAYDKQSGYIKAWWEAMDDGQHKSLLTTTLIGVGIGLLVGFMLPNVTASIETAFIGTIMLFVATRGIFATYSSADMNWLPSKPQHIFITVGLITALGMLLQWTFFRKSADK